MHRWSSESGFTLIELMVVVMIIGILVAIAMPVFANASSHTEQTACFANERTVEGAYHNYLMRTGVVTFADTTALWGALVPGDIARIPTCRAGGTYSWTNAHLTCSVHGHY